MLSLKCGSDTEKRWRFSNCSIKTVEANWWSESILFIFLIILSLPIFKSCEISYLYGLKSLLHMEVGNNNEWTQNLEASTAAMETGECLLWRSLMWKRPSLCWVFFVFFYSMEFCGIFIKLSYCAKKNANQTLNFISKQSHSYTKNNATI